MKNGRRLAFDFGSVRIGVAVTDLSGIISSPLDPILNDEDLKSSLKLVISQYEPIYLVVGIPKHLSGKEGQKVDEVNQFVIVLKEIYSGAIYGIDERLSTVSAASKLRDAGHTAKDSKNLIDSASAVGILEGALSVENNNGLSKCEL
jgi:putative Holliday junction resolvase